MKPPFFSLLLISLAAGAPVAAEPATPKPATPKPVLKVFSDPGQTDADFQYQGEYASAEAKLGGQVRALGNGQFRTMFFAGGLPGAGWDGKTIIQKAPSTDTTTPADSKLEGDKVVIDQVYKGTCDGQTITGQTDTGAKFELKRVARRSPTLGAAAPAGALVLFDGTNLDEWEPGARMVPAAQGLPGQWITSEGKGATTRRKFEDFTLHVEFMISYMPETQSIYQRPNSGVYLQQRYEIQILDSFGIVEGVHDCGVLYAQVTPAINMCFPPLTWQTYDLDFTSARWDAAGNKTKNGRCTVTFNGVTTIDNVEILHSTPGGIKEGPEPMGIYLQAHGHPVFFKNVWIVEKK
jgi:hypothetical protein